MSCTSRTWVRGRSAFRLPTSKDWMMTGESFLV